MNERSAIGTMHWILGTLMAAVAIDTASIEATVAWPKWVLVPIFVAYGFGFYAAALRAGARQRLR